MKIKIKRLTSTAVIPKYWRKGDLGCDLHADLKSIRKFEYISPNEALLIPTGIAIAIPEGIGGFIMPKSGEGHKRGLVLGNLTGVIDQSYTGEIFVSVWNRGMEPIRINHNDRIAQLVFMVVPIAVFQDIGDDNLETTDRGAGGFGHTGKGL